MTKFFPIAGPDTPAPGKALKITIIGNNCTGKTEIFNRIIGRLFSDHYTTTPGIDFGQIDRMSGETRITLRCWDTSSRDSHRHFALNQTRRSDLIILVIDATQCSGNWTEAITATAKTFSRELDNDAQVLIVFSKTDLIDDSETMPSDDKIQGALRDQDDLATRITGAVAVSAKNGHNIDTLLKKIEPLALSIATPRDSTIQVDQANPRRPLLERQIPQASKCRC